MICSDFGKVDLPLEIPERTSFTDEAYGVLGRALAMSTEFECNYRSLAEVMGFRKNWEILKDERAIDEFISFMGRRPLAVHIDGLSDDFQLPDELRESLNKGRVARNYIAHEAGVGISRLFEEGKERGMFVHDLAPYIADIARANALVNVVGQSYTKEPIPTASYLAEYPEKVVEWVCEFE